MQKKLVATMLLAVPVLVVCVVLSGCSAAMGLLLLDKWDEWFDDEDPAAYQVLLDGYDIGTSATASGVISVTGADERSYLVSVARPPEMRKGVHAVVSVIAGRNVNLKNTNPFDGGVISGRVRRDGATGPYIPDLRVIALRDAAQLLANGSGPISIPPGAGYEYMMGYTDSSGAYRLGPAAYGEWLVLATVAGYTADVKHVAVSAGADANAQLVLAEDTGVPEGMVVGAVASLAGIPLFDPLITAFLQTPYEPQIPSSARQQVQTSSGEAMPQGAWFRFTNLATMGSGAGLYQLPVPPGTHQIEAYRRPWHASAEAVVVAADGIATQNFSLVK